MSKKLTKSIASIACAALMASQMFAFNASAIENNGDIIITTTAFTIPTL